MSTKLKPFIYISAPRSGVSKKTTEEINALCRTIYDTGFYPYCPAAYLPHFLRESVPAEHQDGIKLSRFMLHLSCVLVLCGEPDDEMRSEVAMAECYKIPTTTLEGYLTVKRLGRTEEPKPEDKPKTTRRK